MAKNWTIEGGQVLIGNRLATGSVHIADGVFVDHAGAENQKVDASGLLVLPGIIDIHGDAFERQIMPRPKVMFDNALALYESDRQLVANGITTAYHAITISWEPGLRSLAHAKTIIDAWKDIHTHLKCDTRIHLRWETFAFDAVDQVEAWLDLDPAPILAFNDHTTLMVRNSVNSKQRERIAARTGLSAEVHTTLLYDHWDRRDSVPELINRLADAANARGVILLAHDEASPEERRKFRGLGVRTAEFPLTIETAAEARSRQEHVILGAPNVVLGGSQTGAICATTAIERGLCTILASDYYYPALLHAPFKLHDMMDEKFAAAWNLVSKHPAEAAGLDDRGIIAPGKRADFILVDGRDRKHPKVAAVFRNGQPVLNFGTRCEA